MTASSWQDAEPKSFWLDTPDRPAAREPLAGDTDCDLAEFTYLSSWALEPFVHRPRRSGPPGLGAGRRGRIAGRAHRREHRRRFPFPQWRRRCRAHRSRQCAGQPGRPRHQCLSVIVATTALRFSHRWGGAIDTCTRFCAFYGTAMSGQVAYAQGYTGLGVAATRFGATVMLDLLDGRPTELTELKMVRTRPLPFPPEPVAYAGIEVTRRSLAWADVHDGRRNLWLRALDRVGLGFDS